MLKNFYPYHDLINPHHDAFYFTTKTFNIPKLKTEEAGEGTGGDRGRGGGRVGRQCAAGRGKAYGKQGSSSSKNKSKYVIANMPFFIVPQFKGCCEGGRWLSQRSEVARSIASFRHNF